MTTPNQRDTRRERARSVARQLLAEIQQNTEKPVFADVDCFVHEQLIISALMAFAAAEV